MQGERKYSIATANGNTSKRWRNREVTWAQFVQERETPRRTAETQAEFMAMGKAQQDEIKNGRCFVGGYLEGGKRGKGTVRSRSLLTLDADFADADLGADWELLIGAAGCMWPTHKSTQDKPRYRVVAPLSRDVTPDEYVPLALKVMEALNLARFDITCDQPERLFYDPSRPRGAEYRLETFGGEPLDVDAWLAEYADWRDASCWPIPYAGKAPDGKRLEDPRGKRGIIGAFCRCYDVADAIDAFLGDVYTPERNGRWTYSGGTSTSGLRAYDDLQHAKSEHATDPANDGHEHNAFDLVRIHLYGDLDGAREYKDPTKAPSFEAMVKLAQGLPEVQGEMARQAALEARADFAGADAEGEEPETAWMEGLKFDVEPKSGQMLPTAGNIKQLLKSDPEVAGRVGRDVRTGQPVLIAGGLPWRDARPGDDWVDVDDAGLRVWFETKWNIQSKQKISDALELEATANPYDPVREYLDGLPDWDGTERAADLLADRLGAAQTEYVQAVSRLMLTAAVRRAKRPGCMYQYLIVLEGDQGVGKSTFLADLFGEHFADGLTVADMANEKVCGEKLERVWGMEVAELDGMGKASVESVKAFLTSKEPNYRNAYARRACKHPLRCIVIGTVNNEDGYLRDTSGNRRFLPVKCAGRYRRGDMDAERDQIWAEAVELERRTKTLELPEALAKAALEAQRAALVEDPREEIVREYLERPIPHGFDAMDQDARELWLDGIWPKGTGPKDGERREHVTVREIWHEALGNRETQIQTADSRAIGRMLIHIGWERGTTVKLRGCGGEGKAQKVFLRPKDAQE